MQIPFFKLGGDSGGGLNFEVVGGVDEPVNPNENTIWIVTEQEVTGWVISSAQPEEMADGSVWIKSVDAERGIKVDAVEENTENTLIIFVETASQWMNGAFEDVPCFLYKDGEWIEGKSLTYLFKSGNGWSVDYITDTNNESGVSISIDSNRVVVTGKKGIAVVTEIVTIEKETLYLDVTCTYNGTATSSTEKDWQGSLVVKTAQQATNTDVLRKASESIGRKVLNADGVRTTYNLDVSSLIGTQAHIGIAGNFEGTIHNMWLG